MDVNGNPIGGTFGFIRSLMYFVEKFSPTKVYVCWDGEQGSLKRRTILKEYKHGRKVPTLNRTYEFTPDEVEKNKSDQFKKLKQQYMPVMPVIQFDYEFTEADDIVSLICYLKKEDEKIIISADKDFYQLLDEKTVCYNPITEIYKTHKILLKEYNISAKNFAIARALVGDNSDNLKGAKGVGLKSVAKMFPFLSEDKEYFMKDILEHATNNIDKSKRYKVVVESFDHLMKVYNVVQLRDSILPIERINQVKEDLNGKISWEPIACRILMADDFPNFDIDRFVNVFNGLFLITKS